ncbi:MAG: GNAT family N-acetyltransferase [Clostridia bacterium]|nr:GNAT family N-acetyltransferase [Clostridia bacterium]
MITYREATKAEIPAVAKLAAASFGHYPFFDFAFLPVLKTPEAYTAYMEKLHAIHIRANMAHHKCFIGVQDGCMVSAALLQNPKEKRVTLPDYIKAGGVRLVFPVGMRKILDFFAVSEEAQQDCAPNYPDARYLEMLVVAPDRKGSGLGSSMLKDCLLPYMQQQGGKELALITNTAVNCRFYEKNGFSEFAHRTLERNGQQIDNWSFHCRVG